MSLLGWGSKGFDQGHKPVTGMVQPMAGPGNASSQSKVRCAVDAACRHLALVGGGSAYLSWLLLHLMRRRVASRFPNYCDVCRQPSLEPVLIISIQEQRGRDPKPCLKFARGIICFSK